VGNNAGFLAFVLLTVSSAHAQSIAAYGKLPMSFEPNVGQTNAHANFVARGADYLLLLTPTGGTLCSSGSSKMSIKLVRGNRAAQGEGLQPLPGKSNYLIGNDRAQWRTNVANYAKVGYRDVYRGVDIDPNCESHRFDDRRRAGTGAVFWFDGWSDRAIPSECEDAGRC
jgi:hypothetical protein